MALLVLRATISSIDSERAKRTRSNPPSIPLPIAMDKNAATVISTEILIFRWERCSKVLMRAGVPERKKTKVRKKADRSGV
ncbi:MAG: hypothetical protein S4CHLAM102_11680 [Chlamydiia bacterium]|nr:hypothetical protein [Chlamydiia bacterium]